MEENTISLILIFLASAFFGFVVCILIYKNRIFADGNIDVLPTELLSPNKKAEKALPKSFETLLPMRIQAYERIVLYLERISPNNLVMRLYKPGMSARLLYSEMAQCLREEYEHNFSQQIYISENAWTLITAAKDELMQIISNVSEGVGKDADGMHLSRAILETFASTQKTPEKMAKEYLKEEFRKLTSN